MTADMEAAALATASGIHLISVPTPFAVGNVNVYLVEDEPLTLIDCGPASTESLAVLESKLQEHGYSVADIGLLLVTHQHVDHLGLTRHLASASGAEIACLGTLADYAGAFSERAGKDDEFSADLMLLHGVPADTVAALQRIASFRRAWGAPFTASRVLTDGSSVKLRDRTLRVIAAPGHSPTDTLFLDETRGILFGGDHLLKGISSNALITPATGERATPGRVVGRPALIEYMDSLRATRKLELTLVLGGHGSPLFDHGALIDGRLAHCEERAEIILSIILEKTRTAHEIAEVIWGKVAVSQAFLTLSEVLGHVDLLVCDRLVAEEQRSPGSLVLTPV